MSMTILRRPRHRISQIEPVGLAVDFQRHASLSRCRKDALKIKLDRLAAPQEPRRRVADDVDIRVGAGGLILNVMGKDSSARSPCLFWLARECQAKQRLISVLLTCHQARGTGLIEDLVC
jgi:hypothetical protein